MTADRVWAERFPSLFAPSQVGYANADVTFTTSPAGSDDLNRLGRTPRLVLGVRRRPIRDRLRADQSRRRRGDRRGVRTTPRRGRFDLREHDDTHADVVLLVQAMGLIAG